MLLDQHQIEILRNRRVWHEKPLLRRVYGALYHDWILPTIDSTLPGRVVEIGSGLGQLTRYFPSALATDLFPNPWLDLTCDAYRLPFRPNTVSHLVLFDVFHHLARPAAFLREARRVLHASGRLILLEPCISPLSWFVYSALHPEPIAGADPIELIPDPPPRSEYYAAQGNATRLFFRRSPPGFASDWMWRRTVAFSCLYYLLSGGFTRPAFFPERWLGRIQRLDALLSYFPRCFAARCLVVLEKPNVS